MDINPIHPSEGRQDCINFGLMFEQQSPLVQRCQGKAIGMGRQLTCWSVKLIPFLVG